MDFTYLMPAHVLSGRGCVLKNSGMLNQFGKTALIVTGKNSARTCGALGHMLDALTASNVGYDLYDGILPNPTIENIRDASQKARQCRADMIIGIGGGSPMDAAKAIAVLAVNALDDDALFSGRYDRNPLPVLAVPTTAGTGSEVTPYSILTDVNAGTKKNLSHPSLFPKVAFLDAAYTAGLPFDITVNTAVDALSHAVESVLSLKANPMSMMVALEALKILGPPLKTLANNRDIRMETREALLNGSMLAGMAIAQTGTTVVHAMGYSLTVFNNIDHGKANGLLLPEYLSFVAPHNKEKIDRILAAMDMKRLDDLQAMIKSLITLPMGLTDTDIALYTEKTLMAKSVDNTVPRPSADEIRSLYKKSMGNN